MSALRSIRPHGLRVREQQTMRRNRRLEGAAVAGRVYAMQVSRVGADPRLVERRPQLDPVIQLPEHDGRVFGEPLRDLRIEPPAEIVQRGRQVPVIEGDQRLDPVREERVDEPVVKVDAGGIRSTSSPGHHAAPRDAEPVCVDPEPPHQRDVVGVPAVVVTGDVARLAVVHAVRRVREAVPDAGPGAVGERRALDLVGRRRRAPEEVVRELDQAFTGCHRRPPWPEARGSAALRPATRTRTRRAGARRRPPAAPRASRRA